MTHHAYYIEGSTAQFDAYQERLGAARASAYERFGIDEARALIEAAALKNYEDTTFFIAAASITSEAQQALLKLFEEPQPGTRFILLVPSGSLLPTLKSRMLPFEGFSLEPPATPEAKRFLALSGKERSDYLAKMLKDDEGLKERARDFVDALERELAGRRAASAEVRTGLEDLAMVRDYLRDRAPSLKMLLEHLALALPKL